MFDTKPQLAGHLLQHAHDRGIRAAFVAGDEVYGGRDLRRSIRERGTGYVLAVRSNYMVTLPSGRRVTVKNAAGLVKPGMWQRMRTGSATKGAKDYHWAMIEITPDDTPEGHDDGHASCCSGGTATPAPSATTCAGARARPAREADRRRRRPVENRGRSPAGQAGQRAGQRPGHHLDILAPLDRGQPARLRLPRRRRRLPARPRRQRGILGLIPVTVPELLGSSAAPSSPTPAATRPHRDAWSLWRRRHQYRAQQAHQRWHAYADKVPR